MRPDPPSRGTLAPWCFGGEASGQEPVTVRRARHDRPVRASELAWVAALVAVSALVHWLAGRRLSLGTVAQGYAALKPVQSLVMSLAAVPVFAFGRRLMPARYALLAAG